jgi:flagellar protein FliO/FliZ
MEASLATGGAAASTGTTGLAGVMLSLLAVLALIIGLAWLVARLRGFAGGGGAGPLKVAASAAVGLKERIVLVDAAGAWLLLSVAPGRIDVLHRYEARPEGLDAGPAPPGFAAVLARMKKPGDGP